MQRAIRNINIWYMYTSYHMSHNHISHVTYYTWQQCHITHDSSTHSHRGWPTIKRRVHENLYYTATTTTTLHITYDFFFEINTPLSLYESNNISLPLLPTLVGPSAISIHNTRTRWRAHARVAAHEGTRREEGWGWDPLQKWLHRVCVSVCVCVCVCVCHMFISKYYL